MGLLLSVLVVCVGVLEAISCVRHVQHGYLPYWLPARMRPISHEPFRRKPNEEDSSDESSDELSRILQNGVHGRGGKESPSYGLTPILTEHRRRTPILRGDDDADSDDVTGVGHPKYVLENNIDECCTADSNHVGLLTDGFRPISPSDVPEVPLDESYVSSTGKFLEVPADEDSPLQRSSSEETLQDSEGHSPRAVEQRSAPSGEVVSNTVEGVDVTQDVVFKVDEASPIVDDVEQEFAYPESRFSQTLHLDEEGNNITEIPEEEEDLCLTNDPVFNLVSAAAFILRNEAEYEKSDLLPRKGEQVFVTASSTRPLSMDTASSSRPLSMDTVSSSRPLGMDTASSSRPLHLDTTVRIPTPQAHRESMPFDLMAAHASSAAAARSDSNSRPETPGRRSKADISWPVFHPEPVIKRTLHTHAHGDLDRRDSIEEDFDLEGKLIPVGDSMNTDDTHSTDLHLHEVRSQTVPEETFSVPSVPVPAVAVPEEPLVQKVGVSLVEKTAVGAVEDQCSKTVVKGSASAPATSFVMIPGSGRHGSHHSLLEEDWPRPGPATVDKFGRITTRSHKIHPRRRRGSLERTTAAADGGNLKDVMSKSLPDFFFEENMAKANKPAPSEGDGDNKVSEEVPEGEPVGKDITLKESSIKRRRGYRKKTRSTWSPSRAKNRVSGEKSMSSTESFGETDEESKGGSVEEPTQAETTTLVESEAMLNSERTPVEPANENERKTTVRQVESEVLLNSELTPVESANESVRKTTVRQVDSEAVLNSERTPVAPANENATQTAASKVESEAILNIARAPVEVLHHSEVQPESAVFATTTQQPKKRLLKPAKAESFEEAPPHLTQPPTQPPQTETKPTATTITTTTTTKTKTVTVTEQANTAGTRDDVTPTTRAPASRKPDETTAKREDEEGEVEEEEDDDDADQSEATNIKQPQQSSEPAPFWLIFSGEYTKAMSKDWHSGHFCCWQCDESLTGQRYVLRDDHPYCIKCYESVFANMCEECSKTIGIDSKDLSYKDKHWHEACFLCNKCRVSLVDKQFGSKADKIYCSNCYDAQFASRCDGCGEIFRAGTKKMEYKTRQWHEKCFCCCVCKSAIGTKSFIPREQEIYCATCYEEKFATRCVKCNKIITSGGVTYKNEPWHRECFTCTHCNTSLAGQRFTSRDEKPYCAECFGELFAKRCTACSKPITGIGGTRFISFEDRHWHNDCFICATCRTSLVGRGFITDAEDIICPECAKQKLM